MPIVYQVGDLLESDCDMIAHGCNCHHRMKSGIAKQIAKKYPEVPAADKRTDYSKRSKLGSIMPVYLPEMDKCVVNLYTQFRYGTEKQHADYDAIHEAMVLLREWHMVALAHNPTHKLGIPCIGAGLAGGDWKTIETIINEIFVDVNIHVYTLE